MTVDSMQVIERAREVARRRQAVVVLPEGGDPRIVQAARSLLDQGLARPLLLGTTTAIETAATSAGVELDGIGTDDGGDERRLAEYVPLYLQSRPRSNPKVAWSQRGSSSRTSYIALSRDGGRELVSARPAT